MRKSGPSRTAELAAMIRALARYSPYASEVMDDPLAKHFTGTSVMIPFIFNRIFMALNPRFWRTGINSVGFLIAICRHRYMNDLLMKSIGNGFRQVIFLGAGYDTGLLRIQEKIDGGRWIEIDHPNTQDRKRRIIKNKSLGSPLGVEYLGMDLANEDVDNQIKRIKIEVDEPILVIAEGVLSYLPADAFDNIIQSMSGLGNKVRLAADYRYPQLASKNANLPVKRWRKEFSWMKEKYNSYLSQEEMENKLHSFGFHISEHKNLANLWKEFKGEHAPKHLENVAGLFVAENYITVNGSQ